MMLLQGQGQDTAAGGVGVGLRCIIAGSRTITNRAALDKAMARCPFLGRIALVISGAEPNGVDRLGEEWAAERGIAVQRCPADWSLGPKAGPLRNLVMVDQADALVLVWTGDEAKSPGSANVKKAAKAKGIPIHEVVVALVA